MNSIRINNKSIGVSFEPYVIAELSANHNGSIERAKKIIQIAKSSGANAVKLQTYKPETITLNKRTPEFMHKGGLWDGKSLYELYEWAHMPWDWHKPLYDYAKKLDITIFSSPFDNTAVDLLEDLNTPAYKIASFEAIDLPLIKYVAQTGKPIIISTGMADAYEIEESIDAAKEGGCNELAILHCVSSYPASSDDYNLKTLIDMQKRYNVVVGLSDHTINNVTAITSIAMGASIIEKHVTLDRNGGGPDDSFSLEPEDLEGLCRDVKIAWKSLGKVNYDRSSNEHENAQFRRSLYFVKDIQAGEIITDKHVKSIRPGFGMKPKFLDQVIGRIAKINIISGTAVSESFLISDQEK